LKLIKFITLDQLPSLMQDLEEDTSFDAI